MSSHAGYAQQLGDVAPGHRQDRCRRSLLLRRWDQLFEQRLDIGDRTETQPVPGRELEHGEAVGKREDEVIALLVVELEGHNLALSFTLRYLVEREGIEPSRTD